MSQQPGAEPQYSPDGKWWWTGYQWVPVPLTPPRLVHRTVGFRLAAVSVLVLFAACGAVALVANHASGTPSAAVTGFDPEAPNVTSAPTSRPVATPTPASQSQQALAYINATRPDLVTEGNAENAVGTTCGSGQLTQCRAALVSLQTSTSAFQHDLDANPAPSCLVGVDARVRAGLGLENQGAQLATQGLDQIDAAKVNQATALMNQADAEFSQAASLMRQAQC